MMTTPNHKPETLTSTARKIASTTARPPEPAPKCPRCDSPNTKFCYYNNYNLTQPRHFCKTCRRYWTKGGALRNVPIGGGCRKNKKIKSSSRSLSGDSSTGTSSHDHHMIGGLKFFQGVSPAMDFQLMGTFPRQQLNNYNQFPPSFGDVSNNPSYNSNNIDTSMGLNYPEMGSSLNILSNLASNIESLSSLNQDLHWKLQQQRLATVLVADKGNGSIQSQTIQVPVIIQKPQPILFRNLDSNSETGSSRKDGGLVGTLSTEWYFDNGYTITHDHVDSSNPSNQLAITNGSNLNHETTGSTTNWGGIQAWSDLI